MTPYYEANGISLYHGDCREVLPKLAPVDVVIADPPYGVTSLKWDIRIDGWLHLLPSSNLWVFGSFKFFLTESFSYSQQKLSGWKYAQEIIWAKHNGSGFHADRFRRIHEIIAQFYKGSWSKLYKCPQVTADATARTVRATRRPTHMGQIDRTVYISMDGGPRLMRSIIEARSCHGTALHPTQKPLEIIKPLVDYSCPPKGTVLDPFAGSGSTLEVCQLSSRRGIGIEKDERYCEIAANRLEKNFRG